MNTIIALIAVGLAVWIWLDGARARELATMLARRLCNGKGVQFLDETVGLRRLGLRRTPDGLRVRRMFQFEYSIEGVGRRQGFILLLGTTLEYVDWDRRDQGLEIEGQAEEGAQPAGDDKGKVVPFRKPGNDYRDYH